VRKLLVANRGEIARRVFATARSMGIATVAVFSDPDHDAPHVADADEAVRLAGATPGETYLDGEAILAAAVRTGADAIHPGYGFLSENAGFARACAAAGITFVGPSPEAIEAMGSKIAAKELMAAAGVPVLEDHGFPLLVKAAFGGGGRGMRIVRDADELDEALAAARREAAAAFGDGTVFTEHYVEDPRHIEVQIFGDTHGRVLHLFERECSIQRRYQKIIEEAPSPAVDAELRRRLCDAAVAAGRALDYVGAGTVEFVVDQAGQFFFLEVNTRLQVEHPVTEMVTGLDLVELQLRVARGEALDIEPELRGWAVEARLYAEDVAAGFVPTSGRLDRIALAGGEGVRVDSGYEDGSTVSTHYDAMLAKVIAWGETRTQAVGRLADALAASQIHGVPTNIGLLEAVLRHPEFAAGAIDTGFLVRHDAAKLGAVAPDPGAVVAAAVTDAARRRAEAGVQTSLPWGWANVGLGLARSSFVTGPDVVEVGYRFGRDGLAVELDGEPVDDVTLWHVDPTSVDLTLGGIRRRYRIHRVGDIVYVDGAAGSHRLECVERLPAPAETMVSGAMLAPLPGSVVRLECQPGHRVRRGQTVLVLEAMKMEHPVVSDRDGVVREVLVAVGDQVESGRLLAVVTDEADQADEDGG
jgi:propionyl-CoA carboxylase alpha chain